MVKTAGADLSAKRGFLAKLNGNGAAVLTGAGNLALFIVDDPCPGTSGANVTLLPLDTSRNARAVAAEVISAAAELQSDGNGKLVAASSGSFVVGIAEEAMVANQLGLFRPVVYIKG